MSEKREKDYNISELGNWNVAKEYSHFKIMKNLYLADEYSNIAIFGFSSLLEELENQVPTDVLKLNGLMRLINILILIIDNSSFACKKPGTKTKLDGYKTELRKSLSIVPALYSTITKNGQTDIKLIDEKYNKVLEIVLDIKSGINEPLNQNHLIFTDKEEFDPKAYKSQITEDATTRG